jgi:hypothetical protein
MGQRQLYTEVIHMTDQRHQQRRSEDMQNCQAHEQNTKDLSALKGKLTLFQWVLTIGMPVIAAGVFTANSKIDQLNAYMKDSAVDRAAITQRVIGLEQDNNEIKRMLHEIEIKTYTVK